MLAEKMRSPNKSVRVSAEHSREPQDITCMMVRCCSVFLDKMVVDFAQSQSCMTSGKFGDAVGFARAGHEAILALSLMLALLLAPTQLN